MKSYLGDGKWRTEAQKPGPPWCRCDPPRKAMAVFNEQGHGVTVFSPASDQPWCFGPHGEGASSDNAAGPCVYVGPAGKAALGPKSVLRFRYWMTLGTEAELARRLDALWLKYSGKKSELTNAPITQGNDQAGVPAPLQTAGAGAAECPVGFEAMQRLERLPVFLPNGTQTKQFITYDPSGGNESGFFKRYELNPPPEGISIWGGDFESNGFDGWTADPNWVVADDARVYYSGWQGKHWAWSGGKGEGAMGKLTSKPFKLDKDGVRLLMAGWDSIKGEGSPRKWNYVTLNLADGTEIARAYAPNSTKFVSMFLDGRKHKGQMVYVQAVDDADQPTYSMLCIDDVRTADVSNNEYVFFDEIGPGFLCRQQMNVWIKQFKFPSDEVRIRYYFDDEPKPRIDMTFDEFFGKDGRYTSPFTPPLAYFDTLCPPKKWKEDGSAMFAIMYYPLPFQKRLKITAYHPTALKQYHGTWFQYTYLKYPAGTPVETWKGLSSDSPAVRRQFENMGQDPKPPIPTTMQKNTLTLAPGETKTALDLTGQGAIMTLRLGMQPWTNDTFYRTRLRITWDDQAAPAVDLPIGCFLGGGGDTIGAADVSTNMLKTLMFGFDAKTGQGYSYWPMPYWSRAKVEVINDSRTPLSKMEVEAAVAAPEAMVYPAGQAGYFGVKRTVDISRDKARFSTAFQTRGRGKVVGLMMYSLGYNMDGDEFTYIDGSRTPQIHGDGTEDDHNQGWGGYAIQKPYWGGLVNGFQGGYRLYIPEPYVFDSSINMLYEHSPCGPAKDHGQKTDNIVWFYQDAPGLCNLKLTDEFDVGKPDSERAHHYSVRGETWSGTTVASYDRMEYSPTEATTTDDGRAFAGASEFTVKVDPTNEGVKIRRRVNRNRSNVQRTNVYVDGRLMADAPWYVCDLEAPPQTAFRDEDYVIPAACTKGKDRLTIKLEHVSGQRDNSSNEYYYWAFCYVRTAL